MEYSQTVQNAEGLTELEVKVLNASRVTAYGDSMEFGGTWSFSVADAANMNEKIYRGVVASLVKKGLVNVQDHGERNRFEEMAFSLTVKGKERFTK